MKYVVTFALVGCLVAAASALSLNEYKGKFTYIYLRVNIIQLKGVFLSRHGWEAARR